MQAPGTRAKVRLFHRPASKAPKLMLTTLTLIVQPSWRRQLCRKPGPLAGCPLTTRLHRPLPCRRPAAEAARQVAGGGRGDGRAACACHHRTARWLPVSAGAAERASAAQAWHSWPSKCWRPLGTGVSPQRLSMLVPPLAQVLGARGGVCLQADRPQQSVSGAHLQPALGHAWQAAAPAMDLKGKLSREWALPHS